MKIGSRRVMKSLAHRGLVGGRDVRVKLVNGGNQGGQQHLLGQRTADDDIKPIFWFLLEGGIHYRSGLNIKRPLLKIFDDADNFPRMRGITAVNSLTKRVLVWKV